MYLCNLHNQSDGYKKEGSQKIAAGYAGLGCCNIPFSYQCGSWCLYAVWYVKFLSWPGSHVANLGVLSQSEVMFCKQLSQNSQRKCFCCVTSSSVVLQAFNSGNRNNLLCCPHLILSPVLSLSKEKKMRHSAP